MYRRSRSLCEDRFDDEGVHRALDLLHVLFDTPRLVLRVHVFFAYLILHVV